MSTFRNSITMHDDRRSLNYGEDNKLSSFGQHMSHVKEIALSVSWPSILLVYSLMLTDVFLWVFSVEAKFDLPHILKYIISVIIISILFNYRNNNHALLSFNRFGLVNILLYCFIVWSMYLLVSSYYTYHGLLSYTQILFAGRYYFMPFLIPIIILLSNFELEFFHYLFKVSYFCMIGSCLLQVYIIANGIYVDNWFEIVQRINVFQLGSTILLLTSHLYKNQKYFYVGLVNYSLMLFILLSTGRRGLSLEIIFLFVSLFFVRINISSVSLLRKIIFSLIMLIVSVSIYANFDSMTSNISAFQRGFSQEAVMESRGTIWADFFIDFDTTEEWMFGRGLNGNLRRTIKGGISGKTIETGYLYIIYKGGLLYLIPMGIFFLRAAFLGFFRSENDLMKAFAIVIMLHLLNMVSFGLPDYSSKYMLVWIAVISCSTAGLRNISNSNVMLVLNSKYRRTVKWN